MTDASDPVVTMRHVRQARLCAAGGRAFMARYGLDWGRFLREGMRASELEATGDAAPAPAIAAARAEEAASVGG